jgi:hypothetical protein
LVVATVCASAVEAGRKLFAGDVAAGAVCTADATCVSAGFAGRITNAPTLPPRRAAPSATGTNLFLKIIVRFSFGLNRK